MAITKIPVHGADITSTILALLVPDYFDSYEESSTPGTYNLYKNSTLIATVTAYGQVILKYNGGASSIYTVDPQYTLDYIYSCQNGLAFQFHYGNEGTAIRTFLTKDNNGDPVVVSMPITPASPNSTQNATAANHNSLTASNSLPYYINLPASNVTSIAPIALNDDYGSYCPNAYVMMYRQSNAAQSTGVGEIIDIGGTKYISNGGMALKDE